MISKYINTTGFGLILLCILLPFLSIKCNDTKLVTFHGYDLIFGKSFDAKNPMTDTKNSLFGDNDSEAADNAENITADKSPDGTEPATNEEKPATVKKEKGNRVAPSPFIILLEILALPGLIMALRNSKTNWIIAIVIVQLVCLFATIAILNAQMGKSMGKDGAALNIVLKLGYEVGFWLTTLALVGLFVYNIYLKVSAAKQLPTLAPIEPETNDTTPLS